MTDGVETRDPQLARDAAARFKKTYEAIREEIGHLMVGQDEPIEGVLTALFAGGHVLLEGVPGLGKTMLVRALGEAVHLDFSRIQFTPDMMPADIQGTQLLVETEGGGHELKFQEGPLVANLVLADEINRATPKTQSALLEAMQEQQITVGRRTIPLQEPYCVMATQNPVEQEGTYPLPEAQLDRFLMKLIVGYPAEEDYAEIVDRTTGNRRIEINKASSGEEVMELRKTVRGVLVPEQAKTYAIRLVIATQPGTEHAPPMVDENVSLGSSPRGVQSLLLCSKVKALLAGRFAISVDDLRKVTHPSLRHRVMINFQGQSDGVTPDRVIDEVLATVQPPHGA